MYFNSVEIENIGPIENLKLEFPVSENHHPKPIIIVGENGTGKSILISHLVNVLLTGKQLVYENTEIDQGRVYKLRSPSYITSGKNHYHSSIKLADKLEFNECQLIKKKSDFQNNFGYIPNTPVWNLIPANETSGITHTFNSFSDLTESFYKKQCCLYFPVNRFEEPAWLNLENLKTKASYSDLKHISGFTNRNIICTSPMKVNKDWLLDLLFDRHVFEILTQPLAIATSEGAPPITAPVFFGFSGQSTNVYEAVIQILKVILKDNGNIRLGAGTRKNRQISIIKDEVLKVPNLFQLSTGEIQLLNLFFSIIRDYDLSDSTLSTLNEIEGIVIIDEIDSHLHTFHQKEVLPELIALFPKIQFIITTHSPLFLIGMEEKFGSENFVIFNMPDGEQVASVDFSEFNAAYEAFKETTKHRDEIRIELERQAKPIVFVEGDYDIRYLTKAAELLGKNDVLERILIKDGGGFGNLDKVWKSYDSAISENIPNKIILLYDCDTNKQNTERNLVYKRVIPLIAENPIAVGIENLFPLETINRVEFLNPQFIDTKEETAQRIRNVIQIIPSTKSVNKDEKNNLCNWLCENGTTEDFVNFESIFDIIEAIITPQ